MKTIRFDVKEPMVGLATEIEYSHRWDWCNSRYVSLKLSLLRPKSSLIHDPEHEKYPVIVFLCGGGWSEMDRNVWIPELTYYAKHGYAVASIEYSVTMRTRFPMMIEDIKAAIRYLRSHSEELGLDADKIILMGESAGAYLTGLAALSSDKKEWDVGENLEQSSAVQGAVCLYPPVDMSVALEEIDNSDPSSGALPADIAVYPALQNMVTPSTPPIMILQGDMDLLVPCSQTAILEDALEKAGVRNECYLVQGAQHADHAFIQHEVKDLILQFIDSVIK